MNKKYTAEQRVEYTQRLYKAKVWYKDKFIRSPRIFTSGALSKIELSTDDCKSRWNNFWQGQMVDYEYLEMVERVISQNE